MRRALLFGAVLVVAAACSGDGADSAAPTTTTTAVITTTTTVARYAEPGFDDVEVTRDIAYGAFPELTLDVYEPAGDDARDRPAIIFVHGGGFSTGDKAVGVSPTLADHFARLGYVTVSANYRLLAPGGCSGSNTGDNRCATAAIEGVHDGQAAVRWLRANAATHGVDPDRIGIAGESAGGVIAYGTASWSDAPGESGTPGVSSEVQAFMSLSGGLPDALFAGPGDAPGILFASTGDPVVPHAWSQAIATKYTDLGIPVELVTYDGDVHVPFREQRDDIVERTTAFFLTHLVGS